MRALIPEAVLAPIMAGVVAGAAQAAEPSMSFHYSLLQGVNQQECLQRARTALTQNGFQLAESSPSAQFGTQGDRLALVLCAPAQPTVFFVSIAGPPQDFKQINAIAQRVRDDVVGQRTR